MPSLIRSHDTGPSAAAGGFIRGIYGYLWAMATTVIVLLTLEAAALIVLLGAQVIADVQRSQSSGTPWHEDPDDVEGAPASVT